MLGQCDRVKVGPLQGRCTLIKHTSISYSDIVCEPDEGISSIASRKSQRETSQREDLAYCVLGIFGVNMQLLYGEGERAFIRLQEEIL